MTLNVYLETTDFLNGLQDYTTEGNLGVEKGYNYTQLKTSVEIKEWPP